MDPQPTQPPASLLAVFGVTELLERILLFLPLRDLLRANEIQKRVRDVMNGSSKIKQALWFEPQHEVSEADIAIVDAYVPEKRDQFWRHDNSTVTHYIHFLSQGLPSHLHTNPFFHGWILEKYLLFKHHRLAISKPGLLRLAQYSTPNASWRSMLLLQPHAAPASLTVNANDIPHKVLWVDTEKLSLRQGLKMSVLAELALENVGHEVEVSFHPGLDKCLVKAEHSMYPGLECA